MFSLSQLKKIEVAYLTSHEVIFLLDGTNIISATGASKRGPVSDVVE